MPKFWKEFFLVISNPRTNQNQKKFKLLKVKQNTKPEQNPKTKTDWNQNQKQNPTQNQNQTKNNIETKAKNKPKLKTNQIKSKPKSKPNQKQNRTNTKQRTNHDPNLNQMLIFYDISNFSIRFDTKFSPDRMSFFPLHVFMNGRFLTPAWTPINLV